MGALIVQFPNAAARTAHPLEHRKIPEPPSSEGLTETARNAHLRQDLKEPWRRAEAATEYWKARREFNSAISRAQVLGIAEGRSHPETEDDWMLVGKWREALAKQILTPAPDVASANWKQTKLGDAVRAGLEPHEVERIIAKDLAFLAAHPTRRSKPGPS